MPEKLTVPGHRVMQGERELYVLTPTIGELLRIIPERANPDVVQDANRRLYMPHGQSFGDYLLHQSNWVSGAFMAGVTRSAIEGGRTGNRVTIFLDDLPVNVKLFDGQHRRYGIEYALRRCAEEIDNMIARLGVADDEEALRAEIAEKQAWAEKLLSETIVLLLYVEDDIAALQQMFADVSKVRIPDANTKTVFDRADPFNVVALELATTHPVLKGRVEMQRPNLSRNSAAILSINQVATVLRTLFGGVSGRITEPPTALAVKERGTEFFDDLVSSYATFKSLIEGKAQMPDVRERGELPTNSTIIRVIAAIWRELHVVDEKPRKQVVDFLSTLPTLPSEEGLWVESGILPARAEKATPLGRAQEMRAAVSQAVDLFAA